MNSLFFLHHDIERLELPKSGYGAISDAATTNNVLTNKTNIQQTLKCWAIYSKEVNRVTAKWHFSFIEPETTVYANQLYCIKERVRS